MYQQSSIQVSPEERDRRQRMYIFEAELRKAGCRPSPAWMRPGGVPGRTGGGGCCDSPPDAAIED